LNLSNNRLCGVWVEYDGTRKGNYRTEGINAIADALRVHGALTSVELRGNQLGDNGWGAIFAAICGSKDSKITSLDASSENIGPVGGHAVAAMVAVTGALTSIDLSKNNLTDYGENMTGVKELAAALGVNSGLTALDLTFNNLMDEGVSAVCEAIQSNKETKLASLNFKNNGISPGGANAVAAMVAVTGGLTSLNLSDNQLCGLDAFGGGTYTAVGITAIADALRVNGGLTALDLSFNNLMDEGVSEVCEAIQNNKETKLASLNFESNRIGPVGANAVAAMVAVNGALTKLSLANNQLEEEGTKAICEALEQNTSLKELDISGGYKGSIGGSAGAKHVAKMLGVNGGLTSINLSGNRLCGVWTDFRGQQGTYTSEGITAIADAMRVNGALIKCDLSNNGMGKEGKASILSAAQGKAGFNLHL
jgi:Ran GTPase-activating protein (RanGAP) involved in mRNA processing and transport